MTVTVSDPCRCHCARTVGFAQNGEVCEAAGRLPGAGMERRLLQLQGAQARREAHQGGSSAAKRRGPRPAPDLGIVPAVPQPRQPSPAHRSWIEPPHPRRGSTTPPPPALQRLIPSKILLHQHHLALRIYVPLGRRNSAFLLLAEEGYRPTPGGDPRPLSSSCPSYDSQPPQPFL
jgi:hypothetical protein